MIKGPGDEVSKIFLIGWECTLFSVLWYQIIPSIMTQLFNRVNWKMGGGGLLRPIV